MEDLCCKFYEDLFTSSEPIRANIEKVVESIGSRLSESEKEFLDKPFTRLKVQEALFQMHPNKSPGLDGFSSLFFRSNWVTIGDSVFDLFLRILNEDLDASCVNSMLVVLILKINNLSCVSQYRLISLCNMIYKAVSKFLTNRMKSAMDSIILECQSTLVGSRQIFDNAIVGFECMHKLRGHTSSSFGHV